MLILTSNGEKKKHIGNK